MLDWLKLVQAIGRRVWGPRKLKWSIKHPVELVELVGVLLNRSLELKTETKLILNADFCQYTSGKTMFRAILCVCFGDGEFT